MGGQGRPIPSPIPSPVRAPGQCLWATGLTSSHQRRQQQDPDHGVSVGVLASWTWPRPWLYGSPYRPGRYRERTRWGLSQSPVKNTVRVQILFFPFSPTCHPGNMLKKMPKVDIELWTLPAFKSIMLCAGEGEKYGLLVLRVVFSKQRAGMLDEKHSRPVVLSGAAIVLQGTFVSVTSGAGGLLTSSGWTLEELLNVLPCTGPPTPGTVSWPMSTVPRSMSSVLGCSWLCVTLDEPCKPLGPEPAHL